MANKIEVKELTDALNAKRASIKSEESGLDYDDNSEDSVVDDDEAKAAEKGAEKKAAKDGRRITLEVFKRDIRT